MNKQVKFMCDGTIYNGIMLKNGSIICAHCGTIIKQQDPVIDFKLIKVYDTWVDFSDYIGDEEK